MGKAARVPTIVRVEVGYVAYDTGAPRGEPSPAEEGVMADRLILATARAVLGEGVRVARRLPGAGVTDFAK